MKKLVLVLGSAALLSACSTVQQVKVDPTAATAMRGKTVVRTTRAEVPAFGAATPGKAAFAVVGALAMISAGNELIKVNHVPVPADAISAALGDQLQSARGMRLVAATVPVTSSEPAQIAAAAAGKADYVLDVQTLDWKFIYFPTAWGRYKVMHMARASLIDVSTKQVVAQGRCTRDPVYTENAPTYDQLVDNQAAGLKKELDAAAKECVVTLGHDII